MNLNKAFILGRLTKDPESRALPSGQSVANFGVATNRVWLKNGAKQENTEYHNVVVFGKLADICTKYLAKGRLVLVEGRIQTRSWDAQDGTKKYRTEIIADGIQLGPKSSGGASLASSGASAAPKTKDEDIPIIEQNTEEIDVSDIPF